MTYRHVWHRAYVAAKPALVGAVVAGFMAVSGPGHAATITGTLAGFENGASNVDLLLGPYDFNAGFTGADAAGSFTFNFENTHDTAIVISVVSATIGQSAVQYFTDGVYTSLSLLGVGLVEDNTTAQQAGDAFSLQALLDPGDIVSLVFNYGDPVSPNESGPDIDFNVVASVVPLPAGLLLFLSGLAGIGFLGRYKARRNAPAAA